MWRLCSTTWRSTQQEQYEYQDAVTQFLINLYVDFDFEGAQQKLAECETVLENDFFLTALKVPGATEQHDLLCICHTGAHRSDVGMLKSRASQWGRLHDRLS